MVDVPNNHANSARLRASASTPACTGASASFPRRPILHRIPPRRPRQFRNRSARPQRSPGQLRHELDKHGVLLSTTEHLLAAIYSCGIDNIYIDIDSIEVPILDGSAEPFMQMLEQAGTRRLRRKRRYLKVLKPLEVIEGDRRIGIYPADEFRVRCYVDFPHPLVGQQEVEMLVSPETFAISSRAPVPFASSATLRRCAPWA